MLTDELFGVFGFDSGGGVVFRFVFVVGSGVCWFRNKVRCFNILTWRWFQIRGQY